MAITMTGENEAHRSQLDSRLHEVAWGLLRMLTGIMWLVPSARVPEGAWLLAVCIVIIGFSLAAKTPAGALTCGPTRRGGPKRYDLGMRNEFTAIVEQDGPWHVASCAEIPGANGQGATREECLASLSGAIALILEHRRDESLRSLPPGAKQELVVVG